MKKLHREPIEENKYMLTPESIRKLKIVDRSKLQNHGFWYNSVIWGWCFSEEIGDGTCCSDNSFWLCAYDEEIREFWGTKKEVKERIKKANTVDFSFGVYGGHCNSEILKFYSPKYIENENDLVIQEKFIKKINELIDDNIFEIV